MALLLLGGQVLSLFFSDEGVFGDNGHFFNLATVSPRLQ
jgi:hypothetical protein